MNCSAAGKAEASPKIREAETAKVLSTEGIVKFRNCLPLEEAEMIVDKNIKRGIVEENTEEAVEKTLGDWLEERTDIDDDYCLAGETLFYVFFKNSRFDLQFSSYRPFATIIYSGLKVLKFAVKDSSLSSYER
jgi:hypothetical protein